jgi:hypothetical protein
VSDSTVPLGRRALLATTLAGSLVGGIWGTGFARLIQGANPRLSILGDDSWQVALLTAARQRVLLCIGEFTESPVEAIDRVLGSMRPRIDIVLLSRSAAALLGGALARTRHVSVSIVLDGTGSVEGRSTPGPQRISGSGFTIDVVPLTEGTAVETSSWLVNLDLGGPVATFGPNLETILEQAPSTTAVAVSPVGDLNSFHRRWPSRTVVINADSARDYIALPAETEAFQAGSAAGFLVRTFPRDVARFEAPGGTLSLPRWAQSLE